MGDNTFMPDVSLYVAVITAGAAVEAIEAFRALAVAEADK
jgi:hypothetical protein